METFKMTFEFTFIILVNCFDFGPVCVCVFLLHDEYQNTHFATEVRTSLGIEDILLVPTT